jgi:putative ABC transport system permease protein
MLRDLHHSTRVLRRNPAFSVTVILTLALGIGLTTAIFTVVYGVLLRPLPYSNPAALVTGPAVSLDKWSEWRRETHAFEDIGLYDFGVEQLLFAGEQTSRVRQAAISSNLLSILGVRPILGRDFQAEDSEAGAEPVVMLTDAAWRLNFGAREDVVGTVAPFDPVGRRVIGVLPADFVFPMRSSPTLVVRMLTPIGSHRSPGDRFNVVARLRQGATLTQARAEELANIGRVASENLVPATPRVMPLAETMLGANRQALMMLLGAVGFLLLIACANVTNLLFAKGADAHREFAIRIALGASRGDVARLILVQSCMLALAGGALGLLCTYATFDGLMALVPRELPRSSDISLDAHVFGFAFLLSFISGAALGIFPAWQLARGDFQASLRSHERVTLPARQLRLIVLAAEVSLTVVLLCGAALLARSFIRLSSVDLGFIPRHVLALHVRKIDSRYPTVEGQREFLGQVLDRIAQLPAVTSAGAVEMLPVTGARRGGEPVAVDGIASPIRAEPRVISPGYVDAMSVSLSLGRQFAAADVAGAPQVAIVNETFARMAWPGVNPIGRRLQYEGDKSREVVGVMRDVRIFAFDMPPEPQIYIPYGQTWLVPQQLVVHTVGDPAIFAEAVRREIQQVDSRASAEDVEPLSTYVAAAIAQPRFRTSLLAIFASSGLLLAVVGVAGVVSYGVSRRRRELGIRVALGAQRRDLVRTVMTPSLVAVGLGTLVGVAGALALGRLVRVFLFEIEPYDPLMLGASVAVLALTAVASAWVPARRAARVDPLSALRAE